MENRAEHIELIWEYYNIAEKLLNSKVIDYIPTVKVVMIHVPKIIEMLGGLIKNINSEKNKTNLSSQFWNKVFEENPILKQSSDIVEYFIRNGNIAINEQKLNLEKEELTEKLLDLKDFINLIIEITEPKEIPNSYLFESQKALPFCLKYLYVSDYKSIQKIEGIFDLDCQFIVFLGYNGDGKTSILQAIGTGLWGDEHQKENEFVRFASANNSYIEVQVQMPDKKVLSNTFNSFNKEITQLTDLVGYGASRLQIQKTTKETSPILGLFDVSAELQNLEPALLVWKKHRPQRYQAVIDILINKDDKMGLLPNICSIDSVYNEQKDKEIFYYHEKGGSKIEQDYLSAGNKSIVAMIGDMIIRLAQTQSNMRKDDPKEFIGIVLIDELETHLHPKWQRDFPKILSETFPKVQFIVTTHSAICLLGMPENSAFYKVKRTQEEGTTVERLRIDVKNLLPNQILTSTLFDMEVITSASNTNTHDIHLEDTYPEILKREEVRKDIAKILSEKYKKQD